MSRDLYDVAGLEGFLTPCLVYYKDINSYLHSVAEKPHLKRSIAV